MDQLTKWHTIVDELDELTFKGTNSKLYRTYQVLLTDIKRTAKKYIEDYESLSFSKRLEAERLLGIGDEIKQTMISANKVVTNTITDGAMRHATNGYYGTFYGMEGLGNINVPMALLDEKYILQLVTTPVDGKKFSQRLYTNTMQLAEATQASLTIGAVDGKGYSHVAKRIEDLTEANYKRAVRIARTEGGRVSSLATQRAYSDAETMGINLKKRWVSTLDKWTRVSHRELDGQTVGIDEDFTSPVTGAKGKGPRLLGRAGEDINCRCTTIPIVDDYDPELRRDNETGDHIKNMTYNQWLDFKGVPKTPPKVPIKTVVKPKPTPQPAPPKAPEAPTYVKIDDAYLQESDNYIQTQLSDDEAYALKRYTGVAYSTVNRALYLNDAKMLSYHDYLIDPIDRALKKHPLGKNLELYRGMKTFPDELIAQSGISKSQMVFIDELLDSYKYSQSDLAPGDLGIVETIAKKLEGTSYVHTSYMSTSHNRNKANNFGPIRFILNTDTNVPGLAIESISEFDFEKEVIIGRGMKIEIDKVELEDVNTTNGLQAYLKITARVVKP